ncbi:MAG: hypothetical protein AABY10_01430 [Nanoarchaeota archaeon]
MSEEVKLENIEELQSYTCESCGFRLLELKCKLICKRCGYFRSCSDLF